MRPFIRVCLVMMSVACVGMATGCVSTTGTGAMASADTGAQPGKRKTRIVDGHVVVSGSAVHVLHPDPTGGETVADVLQRTPYVTIRGTRK